MTAPRLVRTVAVPWADGVRLLSVVRVTRPLLIDSRPMGGSTWWDQVEVPEPAVAAFDPRMGGHELEVPLDRDGRTRDHRLVRRIVDGWERSYDGPEGEPEVLGAVGLLGNLATVLGLGAGDPMADRGFRDLVDLHKRAHPDERGRITAAAMGAAHRNGLGAPAIRSRMQRASRRLGYPVTMDLVARYAGRG